MEHFRQRLIIIYFYMKKNNKNNNLKSKKFKYIKISYILAISFINIKFNNLT
jgi:hypothetical protein